MSVLFILQVMELQLFLWHHHQASIRSKLVDTTSMPLRVISHQTKYVPRSLLELVQRTLSNPNILPLLQLAFLFGPIRKQLNKNYGSRILASGYFLSADPQLSAAIKREINRVKQIHLVDRLIQVPDVRYTWILEDSNMHRILEKSMVLPMEICSGHSVLFYRPEILCFRFRIIPFFA